MASKGPGPAGTLLIEDEHKKMIHRDGSKSYKREKLRGILPKGNHCMFGDFPPDSYSPRLAKERKAAVQTSGKKAADATATTGSTTMSLSRTASAPPGKVKVTGEPFAGVGGAARGIPPPPPRAGALVRRPVAMSEFRRFYDRGDLPVQIFHGAVGGKVAWKVDVEKLDYHHYLPIFFDGCREKEDPYRFIAIQGTYDMLEKGGTKVLPVVPQLIVPIKTALNTRDPEIIATMLKILQALVLSGEMIGEAMVPYYRQILPIFNLFRGRNQNLGDGMDYGQRKRLNLGDLIEETLQIMEVHGGEDAFINIKYMIPVYESYVMS